MGSVTQGAPGSSCDSEDKGGAGCKLGTGPALHRQEGTQGDGANHPPALSPGRNGVRSLGRKCCVCR